MSSWMFEMLPPLAFQPEFGRMRLYGGKGGSSAPPPDPKLVEAQIKSMGIQDDVIQRMLSNSESMLPLQKEQLQFGLDTAKTAYEQSQEDRGWMLDRRGKLSGMQDKIVDDATRYSETDRANQLTGQVSSDINQAFDSAKDQQSRNLSRSGVNPESGRALALGNQMGMGKALALAQGFSGARQAAKAEGLALTDRANNALAGYPAMGMQATGMGAGYGASGLGMANNGLAGMNSGFGAAGGMAGQMGQNASSMFGQQANYQLNSNAQDANASAGLGSAIGGIAMAI